MFNSLPLSLNLFKTLTYSSVIYFVLELKLHDLQLTGDFVIYLFYQMEIASKDILVFIKTQRTERQTPTITLTLVLEFNYNLLLYWLNQCNALNIFI